jgi:hypothetical protein
VVVGNIVSDNTGYGIHLTTVTDAIVMGNQSYDTRSSGKTQTYGLRVDGGGGASRQIIGNNFSGNATGAVTDASSGSVYLANIPALTQDSVSAYGGTRYLGFFGTTPVVRPSAYTQTYATASRTHAAYTADVENVAYTGSPATAADTAKLADLNALRVAYENLRAGVESQKQVLNSVIDDLQALGLLQ